MRIDFTEEELHANMTVCPEEKRTRLSLKHTHTHTGSSVIVFHAIVNKSLFSLFLWFHWHDKSQKESCYGMENYHTDHGVCFLSMTVMSEQHGIILAALRHNIGMWQAVLGPYPFLSFSLTAAVHFDRDMVMVSRACEKWKQWKQIIHASDGWFHTSGRWSVAWCWIYKFGATQAEINRPRTRAHTSYSIWETATQPVILWILLGGKPKWLPLNFGYNDEMQRGPIRLSMVPAISICTAPQRQQKLIRSLYSVWLYRLLLSVLKILRKNWQERWPREEQKLKKKKKRSNA